MNSDVEVEKITDKKEIVKLQEGHYLGIAMAYHTETEAIKSQVFKIVLHNTLESAIKIWSKYGIVYYLNNKLILYCNAKECIEMARRLMCEMQAPNTLEYMKSIKEAILEIDPALAIRMQPNCIYRGGNCFEVQNCGRFPSVSINYYKELYG